MYLLLRVELLGKEEADRVHGPLLIQKLGQSGLLGERGIQASCLADEQKREQRSSAGILEPGKGQVRGSAENTGQVGRGPG